MNATHLYQGKPVELLDTTPDGERAFIVTEDVTMFPKMFIRHQGYCSRMSGYVQLAELLSLHDATQLSHATQVLEQPTEPEAQAAESALIARVFGDGLSADAQPAKTDSTNFPTYSQLINGAKLTDEHRAHIHKTWNERYR